MNCLPIGYESYDLCVPQAGAYQEILNSESDAYDGCGMNTGVYSSEVKSDAEFHICRSGQIITEVVLMPQPS